MYVIVIAVPEREYLCHFQKSLIMFYYVVLMQV